MQPTNKLTRILFPTSTKWGYWVLIALVIKSFLFFWQIHTYRSNNAFWGIPSDDIPNYLTPIENLIHNGKYYSDYRMPGYGALYLPFILFFPQLTAMNFMILVQLLFSGISVYALALTAEKIFKNSFMFYCVFYIYAISYFTSTYDAVILTESLSTSVLILSAYYLVTFITSPAKGKYLLYSGSFLTWGIFLRPILAPILILFSTILFLYYLKEKKPLIRICLLFLVPFSIADGAWVIRNYNIYHRIIPLTKTEYDPAYDAVYIPTDKFVQAWGGGVARSYHKLDFSRVPEDIYTSAFNADSLKALHDLKLKDSHLSPAMKLQNDSLIITRLTAYTNSIRHEKPFLYYIKAPLRQMSGFLSMWREFSLLFFIKSIGNYLSAFYSALYYGILIFGTIGLLILLTNCFKKPLTIIVIGIPSYIITVHPLILRLCENRYYVPAYPFMLICAVYTIFWVFNKLMGLKKAV